MSDLLPQTALQRLLAQLEPWDNAIGRSCGRKLKRRLGRVALGAFAARLAGLTAADTCLDLGANVGSFAAALAETGARVHAYEPDPDTFARLSANVGHLPNVTLHQKAVGARSGTVHLRRAIGYDAQAGHLSQATSVVFDRADRFAPETIAVKQVGFRDLLADLPQVALVKMDIEGAEFDILADIFDRDMPVSFDALYVETHETSAPERLWDVRRFRRLAADLARPHINLYWP